MGTKAIAPCASFLFRALPFHALVCGQVLSQRPTRFSLMLQCGCEWRGAAPTSGLGTNLNLNLARHSTNKQTNKLMRTPTSAPTKPQGKCVASLAAYTTIARAVILFEQVRSGTEKNTNTPLASLLGRPRETRTTRAMRRTHHPPPPVFFHTNPAQIESSSRKRARSKGCPHSLVCVFTRSIPHTSLTHTRVQITPFGRMPPGCRARA